MTHKHCDADFEFRQHLPWFLFGVIVLLGILCYGLADTQWRAWLVGQYQSGASWALLTFGFLVALVGVCLLLAIDRKRAIGNFACAKTQIPWVKDLVTKCRGSNYSLDWSLTETNLEEFQRRQKRLSATIATGWSALHFVTYAVLGFLAPELWPAAMLVGVGFELFESRELAHDCLDVVWNGLGLTAGISLRKWIDRPKTKFGDI